MRTGCVVGLVVTLMLVGSTASGQSCTGDCNLDGEVTLDEAVVGLNIALGRLPLSDCNAFDSSSDNALTVDELVNGVEALLFGRRVQARGSCRQPSQSGLTGCAAGTVVQVFECRSSTACTGDGNAIAEVLVDDTGTFSAQLCTVGDILTFQAAVEAGGENATYRRIEIVEALQLETDFSRGRASGGGPDFVLDGIDISPSSEATARLVDDNGLGNFDREGLLEILALVESINPDSLFAGIGAARAASDAADRARNDAGVDVVIAMLRRPDVRGIRRLSRGDLRGANEAFREGLTAGGPSEEPSNFFYAITRIAEVMLDDPRIRDVAVRSGVSFRGRVDSICDMKVDFPSEEQVPEDAPRTGETLDVMREVLLPEVEGARSNLARVSDGFQVELSLGDLPDCFCPFPRVGGLLEVDCSDDDTTIEIDFGEVLVLAAAIDALAANLELWASYDADFRPRAIFDESAQDFLALEPQLLRLLSTDSLAAASVRLEAALDNLSQAIEFVLSETDDQENDVLVITDDDRGHAEEIGYGLDRVRQSLAGEVVVPIDVVTGRIHLSKPAPEERLNLDLLFSGAFDDLRPFLPAFDNDGDFDTGRFPDPTFGGTTPDLTQQKIDDLFIGGPPCAPCEQDVDCNAYGLGRFLCQPCDFDCTGDTRRCTPKGDTVECEDGTF